MSGKILQPAIGSPEPPPRRLSEDLRDLLRDAAGRSVTLGELEELLREHPEMIQSVGAVISSLPLLNFPKTEADALAKKIRSVLEPRGRWVQYSYQIIKGRSRGADDFRLIASKIVWWNLPPARVHVFQK